MARQRAGAPHGATRRHPPFSHRAGDEPASLEGRDRRAPPARRDGRQPTGGPAPDAPAVAGRGQNRARGPVNPPDAQPVRLTIGPEPTEEELAALVAALDEPVPGPAAPDSQPAPSGWAAAGRREAHRSRRGRTARRSAREGEG